mmetsp:Transcript_16730/g.20451  ORF Transcript_16730/g.20451 Transcript_16730/m.20451 type:complete len:381 (-) Transcript_16730:538-1680(-)
MRHKRRLVEVLGGVWVLCVLLVSTTAGSHRTLGVIPFVNKSVLTCRGGSSATEDDVNTAPKRRMLFRRDRPSTNREIDKSGDETESDDDSDEPKLNRWWQTNQRSPTALETNGAELSLDDTLDDDDAASTSSKRRVWGTSPWSHSSTNADLHNSTADDTPVSEEEDSAPVDVTSTDTNDPTTSRNNGWKILGKFCRSGCYRCSPSAVFEASRRYDEKQKQLLSVNHPGAYMNHTDADTSWYSLDALNEGSPPATDDDLEDDHDSQLEFEVGDPKTPSATFDQRATDADERDTTEKDDANVSPKQLETETFRTGASGNSTSMIVESNCNQTSVVSPVALVTVPTGVNGTANGTDVTAAKNAAILYLACRGMFFFGWRNTQP